MGRLAMHMSPKWPAGRLRAYLLEMQLSGKVQRGHRGWYAPPQPEPEDNLLNAPTRTGEAPCFCAGCKLWVSPRVYAISPAPQGEPKEVQLCGCARMEVVGAYG